MEASAAATRENQLLGRFRPPVRNFFQRRLKSSKEVVFGGSARRNVRKPAPWKILAARQNFFSEATEIFEGGANKKSSPREHNYHHKRRQAARPSISSFFRLSKPIGFQNNPFWKRGSHFLNEQFLKSQPRCIMAGCETRDSESTG